MAEVIIGLGQLNRRLAAISGTAGGLAVMKRVAVDTLIELKRNTPQKTRHTIQQYRAEHVTATGAEINGSRVARWIDEGTGVYGPRHQRIRPTHGKVLAWKGGTFGPKGSLRLSGRQRKGRAGRAAFGIVVTSTAGMRPRPFIDRAVKDAATRNGAMATIVQQWNTA